MNLGQLALSGAALMLYPGLAAVGLCGWAAESSLARLTSTPPPAVAAMRRVPALAAVACLAALAAAQLAVPFNPLPAAGRSLLVALVAVVAAVWCTAFAATGEEFRAGRALVAQAALGASLLAPALATGSLRPTVIGLVALPLQVPVKVVAAILFVAALPGVLGLLPATTPPAASLRAALWLPVCGLGASLFAPAQADSVEGLLVFVLAVALAAAAAAAGGRLLRGARTDRLYWRALPALAAVALALAAVAAAAG